MKIKYLISTLGLSLALGLGVGAGLSAQNNGVAQKAEADTSCFVRGRLAEAGLVTPDWNTGVAIGNLVGSEYQVLNQIVYTGDEFKFVRDGGTWLGYTQIENSDKNTYFEDTGNDGNIKVLQAAKFNFYVKSTSIWAAFVEYVSDEEIDHSYNLRGTRNDWGSGFGDFEKQQDGSFVSSLHMDSGEQFKFVQDELHYLGYSHLSNPTAQLSGNGDSDITVNASGTYTFTIPSDYPTTGISFTFSSDIADGYYLRGIYQGADENWSTNITLSSASESIQYNSTDNKLYATLELYAGDTIQFVRYENGLMTWVGAASVEASDTTYYNASADSKARLVVEKSGVYYITAGFDNAYQGSEYWWMYVDNSASAWATAFLNSMTCVNGGKSDLTWNVREGSTLWEWDDFATSTGAYPYSKLDDYAKNTFYSASSSDTGTNIEKAIKRHDVCVNHYGWDSFITNAAGTARVVSNAIYAPLMENASSASDSAIAIVVASMSVIAVAGGFFFLKKKKSI